MPREVVNDASLEAFEATLDVSLGSPIEWVAARPVVEAFELNDL